MKTLKPVADVAVVVVAGAGALLSTLSITLLMPPTTLFLSLVLYLGSQKYNSES
jgi:hypothetical protein